MTLQEEAALRYHKLLGTPPYLDLEWANTLQGQMAERHLMPSGRAVCPVLRPHFVTRRQYDALAKASEILYSAIDRVRELATATPALLNRLEMLPAEKMLAGIDPGYPQFAVTSVLDTAIHNGSFHFIQANADGPSGVPYADALSEIFFDAPPVKQFRKRYKLTRMNGMKRLLNSILAAYKVSGPRKFPRIAIVEFRPPFKNSPSTEHLLMAEQFRQAGYPTEIVTPEQLEYRNGMLCRGDFGIEIVYRKVSAQEFLFRFNLTHPLVRAYRERAVCMINGFRTEVFQKKALFGLLTDETVTASFPAAERKAIKEHLPWTRLVTQSKTTYRGKSIDLPEFILKNREKLVLKPNDSTPDLHSHRGWESDDAAWDRALKAAFRTPYVVQERIDAGRAPFPVYQSGKCEIREMAVEVHPHLYMGKMEGCSTQISDASSTFSTLAGMAPTFILESA